MPRARLNKSAIDAFPTPQSDTVYWDTGLPGFGVKVTPSGRKVFIVLYRTGGAGSKLRKYTIGPYGRVTLHQARVAAQKVFAARLAGRDPAAAHLTQVTDPNSCVGLKLKIRWLSLEINKSAKPWRCSGRLPVNAPSASTTLKWRSIWSSDALPLRGLSGWPVRKEERRG
jgi:hypothetical protein